MSVYVVVNSTEQQDLITALMTGLFKMRNSNVT